MVFDISWKLHFFLRVEVTAPSTGQNETSQHCVTKIWIKVDKRSFLFIQKIGRFTL